MEKLHQIKIYYKDIDLYSTLTSGQCFRAFMEEDNSFIVILIDRIINIKQKKDYLIIESNKEEDLKEKVITYFDLKRDYFKINKEILKNNPDFKEVIDLCEGYKILKQNPLETSISFIISQNNKVSMISKSINEFCKLFGEKVNFKGKDYYLFPTQEKLTDLKLEDLKTLKIGYRDKYIINFINKLKEQPNFLKDLKHLNSSCALKELMSIKGIGLKVASCILLFGYGKFDVFPIDTWVKQYIYNKYKIVGTNNNICSKIKEKFPLYTGLCIQYMFHYNRNKIKETSIY